MQNIKIDFIVAFSFGYTTNQNANKSLDLGSICKLSAKE